ncbi:hypothetical protein KIL84_023482 [Mauremys mutica]|uniref:Uncharacterized protein n=1 Tax=Mauremys mutica TaxID=74926 RepID=A0A9D3WRB7_9SAUR|nr:hypothetical protein KIL84_023482 [Mauremys mutica]
MDCPPWAGERALRGWSARKFQSPAPQGAPANGPAPAGNAQLKTNSFRETHRAAPSSGIASCQAGRTECLGKRISPAEPRGWVAGAGSLKVLQYTELDKSRACHPQLQWGCPIGHPC